MSVTEEPAQSPVGRGTRRLIGAILLLLAMAILLATVVSLAVTGPESDPVPSGDAAARAPGKLTPAPANIDPAAERVTVGLYALDAYNINPESSTFYMTGYLWMRWSGDINPVDSLEFVNAVDESDLTVKVSTTEPRLISSGEKVQDLKFQGRFYEPFNMTHYPLDSQRLNIVVESDRYPISKLVFVPDATGSGLDAQFAVPGWNVSNRITTKALVHTFGTEFGYPADSGVDSYSAALFAVSMDRSHSQMIWKILLPLFLVLVTAWLALLVNPAYPEIRMAMPATALLTAVFLQEVAKLPWTSTPVTLDRIYVVAFASIVVTLALVIWDVQEVRTRGSGDAAIVRVQKRDMYGFVITVIVSVGLISLLIYSALSSSLLS